MKLKAIISIMIILFAAPVFACVAADPPDAPDSPGVSPDPPGDAPGAPGVSPSPDVGPDYGSGGMDSSHGGVGVPVKVPVLPDCDLIIYNGKCIKHIRPGLLTVDGKPFYYEVKP